ncbi:hypothetical protein SAMN05660964_03439 [Thiothrix caldifontis]|jgi:hypothetical protein|uniref:Uncharacterized protein n=1 Tax=Thiothrix caldifontis TaxID=525918 RepID=A0A1H4GEE5_9GAMM|nr:MULTISPECIES: hypothetical protein [Thiothrix]QQZ29791.1 hypothetical protein HMY34_13975 [Thiothrix subterranea]SEB07976.1 hypothetical protein SAMN05660964_03439 [Thiothrix caldifontis]
MKAPDDDKLRKANLRVAIILGIIAGLALLYSFIYLPKVLSGGVVP